MDKIKLFTIIVSLFMLLSCAGWSNDDKALMIAYTVGNVIDALQTNEIYNDPNYYEKWNQILEDEYVYPYFAVLTLSVYGLASIWKSQRTYLLGIATATSWLCIYNNHRVGIRINW